MPEAPPERGVLYIAPPLAHSRGKIRRLLLEYGFRFGDPLEDTIAVEVSREDLPGLAEVLREGLSAGELRDSQAILTGKDVTPGLRELSQMQDLGTLVATLLGEWLLDILREKRLSIHFQPVVYASDASEVFAYECLLRGLDKENRPVSPDSMYAAARRAGLLFNLDREARIKAVREAAGSSIEESVFINFDPASIYDPTYCLRSTMNAVERSRLKPEKIVFEITESGEFRDPRQLSSILEFHREYGFRVALDGLGAGYGPGLLRSLRPDFVKLDLELVRGVDDDPYKAAVSARLLDLSRELGVQTIAGGVETEAEYRWFADHGADYVQGHYFAPPASPPPVPSARRS